MPVLLSALMALGGGVATFFAFPSFDIWPAAIGGVALLFVSLRPGGFGRGMAMGTLFSAGLSFPLLWWAYCSVGWVPWIALSLANAAILGLAGAATGGLLRWGWLRRHPLVTTAVFATMWLASEELISRWPFGGFPWVRLAFSQSGSWLGHLAWLGGVPLITWAVAWAGALLATAVLSLRPGRLYTALGAATLAGLTVVSGLAIPLDARAQDGTMTVGAVQGDVPNTGLHAFDQARQVTLNHLKGTQELVNKYGAGTADLVVWPENASDNDPKTDPETSQILTEASTIAEAPLLVGSIRYTAHGRLNTSLLWTASEGEVAMYAKQHPAPFAEYIPMRSIARLFSDKVDLVQRDMEPGKGIALMQVPVPRLGRSVPIGPVICFEVTYDNLISQSVKAGAQLLVVQTNNASFGNSDEGAQQFAMSRIRAMEHGRATIQISTVGISGVILPNGRVLDRTGLFTAEQFQETLPLRTSITPATRVAGPLGNLALGLGAIGLAAALTSRWWGSRKEKR